jgi:DNA polymerase IV
MSEPAILHVDMDAFYASAEVLDNPSLLGKPVIVGGRPGARGVVSAASYEARTFGVRSAMPLVRAGRLCPQGVFLPVRMERYVELSGRIFSIFRDYTPLVEGLSLDEAFLDVRGSTRLFGSGVEIGRDIRRRIREEIGLPCSVGVAPVKFVAKIGSDLEKPNGFVVVKEGELKAFLDPLPVERLWGVGEVTAERLRNLGFTTVGQIRSAGEEFLTARFGEHGTHLYRLSAGIDERGVVAEGGRKSVGHETTFPEDIGDRDVLLAVLLDLTEEVGRRARKGGYQGRVVVLKVRYAPFETHTFRTSLPALTDVTTDLHDAARGLFERSVRVPPKKVRLLGVTLTGLGEATDRQMNLFLDESRERSRKIDLTMDRILDRMGRRAIRRAGGLPPTRSDDPT